MTLTVATETRDERGGGWVRPLVCVEGTEIFKGGSEGMRVGWGWVGEGVKVGLKGVKMSLRGEGGQRR